MEVSTETVATPPPPPSPLGPPTPWAWRIAIALIVVALATAAYQLQSQLGSRGQAATGILCFFGIAAFFSSSLQSVNWRTILFGFALQIGLVLFIDKVEIPWDGGTVKPGRAFFKGVGDAVKQLLDFTNAGSQFVFGLVADPKALNEKFPNRGFIFAFSALPTIIFIASFFSVLYYFGVLQFLVRIMAVVMMRLMGTSGAESLSVTANIFMGQTEAPLIIKPFVPRMTQSELLTMMVGGMAHISGGVMAVYIGMGANAEAILATSVMAAPGSLYLSKLLLPELGDPVTRGEVKTTVENPHINVIDAASAGAGDGMRLALNVAAMLIAFLAFIAMFDYLLGLIPMERMSEWLNGTFGLNLDPKPISLARIFSWLFAPVAVLMGVQGNTEIAAVADLLGTKLVANEFVAYVKLTSDYATALPKDTRAFILATYALTGFANFASIGIQIGGIGALAPSRRSDLARLGMRALLTGFLVTLINASIAGMLLTFADSPPAP